MGGSCLNEESLGKIILIALPITALAIFCSLWLTGVFETDEIEPTPKPIPPTPKPIPPVDIPDKPIIPTEPKCIDKLDVKIFRYDIRSGDYDWLVIDDKQSCSSIDAYKKHHDYVVEYESGYRTQGA